MNFLNPQKKYFGRISYYPCSGKSYVINYVTLEKIYQIIDRLWEEAQEIEKFWEEVEDGKIETIEKDKVLKHHGCFVITKNDDYFQGGFDKFFAPSGGFYLECCIADQRYWQSLPQTAEEVKNLLNLWLTKSADLLSASWLTIGEEEEPISLEHPSRRSFKVKYLLAQYEDGERSFFGQDLSQENLLGINLSGADLRGVVFTKALLNYANLTRTKLSGANFKYANLLATDLRQSDLTDAVLTGAFYDDETEFPQGFDPEKAGMNYLKNEESQEHQSGYDFYKIDFYKKSSLRSKMRLGNPS